MSVPQSQPHHSFELLIVRGKRLIMQIGIVFGNDISKDFNKLFQVLTQQIMVLICNGVNQFWFGVEVEFNCVEQVAFGELDFRLVLRSL